VLGLSALTSSMLVWVSAWAPSLRTAHLLTAPIAMLACGLSAVAFFPYMRLDSIMVVVPFSNAALAVRDVMAGRASPVWVMLASLSCVAYALVFTLLARWRLIADEQALGAPDAAGLRTPLSAFVQRLPLLFATLLGAEFILSLYLDPELGFTPKVLIVQLGLLLPATLLFWLGHRLPLR